MGATEFKEKFSRAQLERMVKRDADGDGRLGTPLMRLGSQCN
jgi:hypothetical protein